MIQSFYGIPHGFKAAHAARTIQAQKASAHQTPQFSGTPWGDEETTDEHGQRWLRKSTGWGAGTLTTSVRLDEAGRPVDKEGNHVMYNATAGEWEVPDPTR